jgi:hypothetical protein
MIPVTEQKRRTTSTGVIRFHLITKLIFEKNEDIINSDLIILSHLSSVGIIELRKFCYDLARVLYPNINPEDYAVKEQNIRNRINKLEKRGFIVKNKKHNKLIKIHDDLQYKLEGPILYKYSLLYV